MCKLKSAIVLKNTIYMPDYDSHEKMLKTLNIEDNYTNASRVFVRVELSPKDGNPFTNIDKWNLSVDQDIRPDWFDVDETKKEMIKRVKEWAKTHLFYNVDDLNVCSGENIYIKDCRNVRIEGDSIISCIYGNTKVKYIGDSARIECIYGDTKVDYISDKSTVNRICGNTTINHIFGSSSVNYLGEKTIVYHICGFSTVMYVSGDARIKCINGHARVGHISDNVKVNYIGSEARIEIISGYTNVGCICGRVRVGCICDNAKIYSIYNNACVDNINGQNVVVQSIFGNVYVNNLFGSAQVKTIGDNAIIKTDVELPLKEFENCKIEQNAIIVDVKTNQIFTGKDWDMIKKINFQEVD